ncbi:MAG: glycosyltransferase family 2 protein [Pseudomonadota bacterium]
MTGATPALSIVLVNYRSWELLDRAVASIQQQGRQLIVVDNASGDDHGAVFRSAHPDVQLIESPVNLGFAGGCNLGAEHAAADWVLFLNPDTEDPGNAIDRMIMAAEREHVAIATCRQVDARGRGLKVFDAFPRLSNLLPWQRAIGRLLSREDAIDARGCRDAWRPVEWVSGSVLLIRRSVLEELGGWSDAYFMYSEDVDLCRRAADAGHERGFAGEIEMLHVHGGSSRSSPAISALTRTEAILSRHIYVSRRFPPKRRMPGHALLFCGRTLPVLITGLIGHLLPVGSLRVRALMARRLLRAYAMTLRGGRWRSLAAAERDAGRGAPSS